MPKRPEYGTPDEENPEWTREDMAKAMRYPNLPPELMRFIEADKKKRGTQIAPKKQAISIRLSPDVLDALRATGAGWQARADEALRAQFLPSKVHAGKRASSSPGLSTGRRHPGQSDGPLRASHQR